MNAELKLEVGKSYRTRGGWKRKVAWVGPDFVYVVADDGNLIDLYANGMAFGDNRDHEEDLLSPWIDRPVITATWPDWSKAAAMDKGGLWYWYENNPRQLVASWYGGFCNQLHSTQRPAWNGDWRESLVVRPS